MHLSPPAFHRIGMAELVDDLDHRVNQRKDEEILKAQYLVGYVGGQFAPVDTGLQQAIDHNRDPQDQTEPAK